MNYNFEKVSVKAVRRWVENGKKRQQTKEFYQTINPYNVNADGSVKSKSEILTEIKKEKAYWLLAVN